MLAQLHNACCRQYVLNSLHRLEGAIFIDQSFYVSCAQHEATKRELEAAKGELGQKTKALEHFQTVFIQKDDEIHRLNNEIRGLKPIAEQYTGLFAEHKELQSKLEAMMVANHKLQLMLCDLRGEKAAVNSRLKELTMVVNQVTAGNEELRQKIEVYCLHLVTTSHIVMAMHSHSDMLAWMLLVFLISPILCLPIYT